MNQQLLFFLNQSLQYIRTGNYDSAELLLKQTLKLSQRNPEVLRLLGVIEAKKENYNVALKYLNDAIKFAPNNGIIRSNMGSVFEALKRHKEALGCYEKAITLAPTYAEAYSNMGNALYGLKRYEEALACHEKAITLAPTYAEAYSNMGNAFESLKRYEEALACHEKAITLAPTYAEAYSNMGNVFQALKRHEEALACHEKAITLAPTYAKAYFNMGNVFHTLKRYEDALACYEKVISLKPNYAEAYGNIGSVLFDLNRYQEAAIYYDKLLYAAPNSEWALGMLQHLKMRNCSWDNFKENIEVLSKKVRAHEKVISPFSLLSLVDDPLLHKECAEIWAKEDCNFNPLLGPIPKRLSGEKIQVGYFSADFRNHPVAFLTAELFELHDRNRFEITAFSFGPDDKSLMYSRLNKAFDRFIDVSQMSDEAIARLARDLGIDIAVDMGGYTAQSRAGIFSYRAAPIQINYLGYPGTMGTNHTDYIVGDPIIIPTASQQFYAEKIIYMPNTMMLDDSQRVASSIALQRREFGIPENVFVFCCFNGDYKFNDQVLHTWSKILLEVKDSILWISENHQTFKINFLIECEKVGIDSSRIIFAQRVESMADHLARYRIADLFLDTFPYNAHTTTVDALKMGLPVLTLIGKSFASRVAASLLSAIRMPELITTNHEEYVRLAIELAKDPEKISSLKERLRENLLTAPLFNTPLYTSHLEKAYIQIYERHQKNLPLEHIYVQN